MESSIYDLVLKNHLIVRNILQYFARDKQERELRLVNSIFNSVVSNLILKRNSCHSICKFKRNKELELFVSTFQQPGNFLYDSFKIESSIRIGSEEFRSFAHHVGPSTKLLNIGKMCILNGAPYKGRISPNQFRKMIFQEFPYLTTLVFTDVPFITNLSGFLPNLKSLHIWIRGMSFVTNKPYVLDLVLSSKLMQISSNLEIVQFKSGGPDRKFELETNTLEGLFNQIVKYCPKITQLEFKAINVSFPMSNQLNQYCQQKLKIKRLSFQNRFAHETSEKFLNLISSCTFLSSTVTELDLVNFSQAGFKYNNVNMNQLGKMFPLLESLSITLKEIPTNEITFGSFSLLKRLHLDITNFEVYSEEFQAMFFEIKTNLSKLEEFAFSHNMSVNFPKSVKMYFFFIWLARNWELKSYVLKFTGLDSTLKWRANDEGLVRGIDSSMLCGPAGDFTTQILTSLNLQIFKPFPASLITAPYFCDLFPNLRTLSLRMDFYSTDVSVILALFCLNHCKNVLEFNATVEFPKLLVPIRHELKKRVSRFRISGGSCALGSFRNSSVEKIRIDFKSHFEEDYKLNTNNTTGVDFPIASFLFDRFLNLHELQFVFLPKEDIPINSSDCFHEHEEEIFESQRIINVNYTGLKKNMTWKRNN